MFGCYYATAPIPRCANDLRSGKTLPNTIFLKSLEIDRQVAAEGDRRGCSRFQEVGEAGIARTCRPCKTAARHG